MKTWIKIFEQEEIKVKLPINKDSSFNVHPACKNYKYGPVYYKEFKNAIINEHQILLSVFSTLSENYLNEFLKKHYSGIRYKLKYLFQKRMNVCKKKKLIVVFDVWSVNNLYHFYFFTLEKIIIANNLNLSDKVFLIPHNVGKFVLEAIEILNIKNTLFMDNANNLLSDIILLSPSNNAVFPSPSLTEATKNWFLDNIDTSISLGQRIYLSRQKSNKRKVINNEEVELLLQNYGFKTLYAENYNLQTQISIFRNANFVISPHGAGLSNIIFMNEKSNVIEFNSKQHEGNIPHYMILSSHCNLNYYYFDSEEKGGDYIVCLVELESLIQKIIKHD